MPDGIPLEGMAAISAQLRQMAKDAGRDPQALEVIVGANISITPKPLGADRPIFAGALEQIQSAVDAVTKLGASEIFLMIFPDGGIEDLLAAMARLRALV